MRIDPRQTKALVVGQGDALPAVGLCLLQLSAHDTVAVSVLDLGQLSHEQLPSCFSLGLWLGLPVGTNQVFMPEEVARNLLGCFWRRLDGCCRNVSFLCSQRKIDILFFINSLKYC